MSEDHTDRNGLSDGDNIIDMSDKKKVIRPLKGIHEKPEARYGNGGKGGKRNEHGLNPQEEAFAQLLAEGRLSASDCYRQTYNVGPKCKTTTVHTRAWTVGNREHVKKRVEALKRENADRRLHDPSQTKAFIVERLWEEAQNTTNRASERLKAIELLGKLENVGAFRERSEVIQTDLKTPDDIRTRIEDLLKKAG